MATGTPDPRANHFAEWVARKFTGCTFASMFAAEARMSFSIVEDTLNADAARAVDGFLEAAVPKEHIAILILPHARTPAAIVRFLASVKQTGRWSFSKRAHHDNARTGCTVVDALWQTADNEKTSVVGFAPLGCMPVTRRAPYVALALWCGKHSNAFARKEEVLGIVGAPHRLEGGTKYRGQVAATNRHVRELLELPREDEVALRRVSFVLPANTAGLDAL